MLEHERIYLFEIIDIIKTNDSHECRVCYYWYVFRIRFRLQLCKLDGCHDLIQEYVSFGDSLIVIVKKMVLQFIFWCE